MNTFHEPGSFHFHPSTVEVITQRRRVQCPDDGVINGKFHWPTNLPQTTTTQDDACASWTPHGNALGLYETYGPEPYEDQSLFPFATYMPNHWQNYVDFSSTPSLHQLLPSDATMHLFQPPLPCYASVQPVEEAAITHLVQQCCPISKPIAHSSSKHTSASRLSSTASHLRYEPYPPGPDSTRRGALSDSLYQCQWSSSVGLCCALVEGTKSAIGKHLQDGHAISIKADKGMEVCQWDMCGKVMRRGSIPRHVLAVHIKHKVHCPGCRSHFARPDSLQRHQRTCLGKIEDAPDTCKVGGRVPL